MTIARTAVVSTISDKCDLSTPPTRSQQGSLTAEERQRALLENLAEVRGIARRIHSRLPRHVPFDDLIHEGVIGLMDAVTKYDPSKNVHLRSYARHRIRGAILDSLRELDKGPRHLRRQARRIEKATSELSSRLGRVPCESEVAARLGVPLAKVQHVLQQISFLKSELSLSLPDSISDEWVSVARSLSSAQDPFEICLRAQTSKVLAAAIEMLTKKERQALTLYYFEERTMKEIGRVLNLQESRISQIISAAQSHLRVHLEKSLKT
ncbi:MAG TPA: FliA/WhiG family RNA polymerase sigma factor [Candidatus Acidoferrum sp.]|nr:FliA/WhiG family RNA polymerase sigma factor [Candidatus Acidoferrum sp.]